MARPPMRFRTREASRIGTVSAPVLSPSEPVAPPAPRRVRFDLHRQAPDNPSLYSIEYIDTAGGVQLPFRAGGHASAGWAADKNRDTLQDIARRCRRDFLPECRRRNKGELCSTRNATLQPWSTSRTR